jgi:proline dehydrogenase
VAEHRASLTACPSVPTAPLRRRLLFALATNRPFERGARALPPIEEAIWRRARRYVAGRDRDSALALTARLTAAGYGASVDFFGEAVADADTAQRAVDDYVDLAPRLPEGADLAVDLSHIGLDVSPELALEGLQRMARALPRARLIRVGAEDSARTDAIRGVVLAARGAPLQLTLQANLRRSPRDWPALVEAGVAIRLVKGAYVEPPELAHPYGPETDAAFLLLAEALSEAGARLTLATHDAALRRVDAEVELLYGVLPDEAGALRDRGVPVRLYLPYGPDWFRYLMRRRAEAQGSSSRRDGRRMG